MNVLLTPEAIRDIITKQFAKTGTETELADYGLALCRAQLRKVVELAEENCVICADSYPYDAEHALFNWQALREAALEGK